MKRQWVKITQSKARLTSKGKTNVGSEIQNGRVSGFLQAEAKIKNVQKRIKLNAIQFNSSGPTVLAKGCSEVHTLGLCLLYGDKNVS